MKKKIVVEENPRVKRNFDVKIRLSDSDCYPQNFAVFRRHINRVWKSIPDFYKNAASLDVEMIKDANEHNARILCIYTREETDEEYNKRVVDLNAIKGTQEEAEMEMYFRLKRKYENL